MCDFVVLPTECLKTDLRQVNVSKVSQRSLIFDLVVCPAECLNTDLQQVNVSKVRVKTKGQKGENKVTNIFMKNQ